MITGNRIAGAKTAAIQGMDEKQPVGPDLGQPGAPPPPQGVVSGNFVT